MSDLAFPSKQFHGQVVPFSLGGSPWLSGWGECGTELIGTAALREGWPPTSARSGNGLRPGDLSGIGTRSCRVSGRRDLLDPRGLTASAPPTAPDAPPSSLRRS